MVELAPDWIEAHINLGVAYYQMGQLSDAREAFLAAVARDDVTAAIDDQASIEKTERDLAASALAAGHAVAPWVTCPGA